MQKVGLGDMLLKEMDEHYRKLGIFPTSYGKRDGRYRRLQLRKFPYAVVFKIIKNTGFCVCSIS